MKLNALVSSLALFAMVSVAHADQSALSQELSQIQSDTQSSADVLSDDQLMNLDNEMEAYRAEFQQRHPGPGRPNPGPRPGPGPGPRPQPPRIPNPGPRPQPPRPIPVPRPQPPRYPRPAPPRYPQPRPIPVPRYPYPVPRPYPRPYPIPVPVPGGSVWECSSYSIYNVNNAYYGQRSFSYDLARQTATNECEYYTGGLNSCAIRECHLTY